MVKDIVAIILSSIIGGAGVVGLIFYFFRKYIENKLNERDEEEKRRRENRIKRAAYNSALQHAQGRLLFWIYRAIVNGKHNGELEEAFADFEQAEKMIKEHDQKIVAESERD